MRLPFNSNINATPFNGRGFGDRRPRRFGGGSRWLAGRIRSLARTISGTGSGGPRDHLIVPTEDTAAVTLAGYRKLVIGNVWGCGVDVGSILQRIRQESPYTAEPGITLEPTVLVSGFTEYELLSTGVSPLHYEYVVHTPYSSVTASGTDAATSWDTAWEDTYDTLPTNYSTFPSTSLLENLSYWKNRASYSRRPTHYATGKIEIGRAERFIFKFKTRAFRFNDYANGSFLSNDGMVPNKSYRMFLSVWGEPVQVCGDDGTENARPMVAEAGTPFMVRVRRHYFYKWIPGNNRPSVYGAQIPTGWDVPVTAQGFIGIPALRAQRASARMLGTETGTGYPEFGGLYELRKPEVIQGVSAPAVNCNDV